jgi:hypothetical protein
MGGSAASSVAGAYAALALGQSPVLRDVIAAALEGESAVAGRHLDNIAPSVGWTRALAQHRSIDVVKLSVGADWWIALVTPRVHPDEGRARVAADASPRASGSSRWPTPPRSRTHSPPRTELLRRALDDRYAEPRPPLIRSSTT